MTTPHQLHLTLLHALNTHDPKPLSSLFAAHFRGFDCAQTGLISGPDGVWASIQTYLRAFSDLNIQMIDAQIGDQSAAVYWTVQATHKDPWMNIPPTGREVIGQGMWMLPTT